ncbi:MAG: putative amidohydrolase YtcJ [Halioglobus sp.]|jgi:predicted amidohydrolase YtcJ
MALNNTILISTLSLFMSCSAVADRPIEAADTVLTNGNIYTINSARSWAEAVAITDGRIVYVGSNAGADAYRSDASKYVDLNGRMVLPSFQDVHIHPISGGVNYTACPLFETTSIEEVQVAVAACATGQPELEVIRGSGWSWSIFGEQERPEKKHLDAIEPSRPIVISDVDGHTLWLNSAALALAGIDSTTKNPQGGEIGRIAGSMEPNGTLLEGPAWDLINKKLSPISDEERLAGLLYAQKYLNSLGITAIQDAYVRLNGTEPDKSLPIYKALQASGELNLRVSAALYWDPAGGMEQIEAMRDARREYSNGRIQANTVKIWADGILESYTAKMLEPYSDKPEDDGLLMVPRKRIMAAVPLLDKAGFQVHIHAIGDATVRYALDAFEEAQKINGRRDSRHLTAHTQVVNPSDLGRFALLDVIAGFTPYWTYADSYISDINPPQLGEERMQQMYPIRSILDSGGRVAFGSDWSVSTADPLLGIEAAVTHINPEGAPTPVFIPSERITLEQAIAGYTIDVAYANFLEDDTGSIEVGKFADLVVLSDNLFDLAPADISEVTVVATLIEGEIVYGDL